LAVVLPSVIGSLSIFYSLLGVSLFVPIVAGLYTRRPGVPEAMVAIAGGVMVAVALRLAGVPGAGFWNVYTWGLLLSGVMFVTVFVIRRPPHRGAPDSPSS
jgi:SSS family solute:Na+ symporter